MDINENNPETFADRVLSCRNALGLSQLQLAKKIGASHGSIQNYENGSFPKGEFAIKLATVFECSIDWLLTGKGEAPIYKDGKRVHRQRFDQGQKTPMLKAKYMVYRQEYQTKKRLNKLTLLYDFLIKSVYGDRRKNEIQSWVEDEDVCRVCGPPVVFIRDLDPDRNIESVKQLADQFNAGKLKEFPPYFPGCSFNVLADRKRN